MWQRHNAQLANFDVTSFACYGYCCDAAGGCSGHLFESLRTETVSPWARLSIWIVDAHRDDRKRFIVRADKKLSASLELESAIRLEGSAFALTSRRDFFETRHR
jgi:hypothetical protein